MAGLFEELKRRKVFNVAVVYAIVSWVIMQIADIVLPTFQAPEWIFQTLIFFLILGFPIAAILAWAYEITPEGIRTDADTQGHLAPVERAAANSTDRIYIFATFGLVLIVAGIQIYDRFQRTSQASFEIASQQNILSPLPEAEPAFPTTVLRSSIILDEVLDAQPGSLIRTSLALTADGSRLYYTQRRPAPSKIYTRLLSESTSELVSDATGAAVSIALSPNRQRIAIRNGSAEMSVLPLNGLFREQLDQRVFRRGLDWFSSDELLYPAEDGTIHRYSLESNESISLTASALNEDEYHVSPQLLPGGKVLLFGSKPGWISSGNTGSIGVLNIETQESRTLIRGGYSSRYAPSGHIVFIRAGNLWAVPFDKDSLSLMGPERMVIEGIHSTPNNLQGSYTFSDSGRLVYLPGQEVHGNEVSLVWVDAEGNILEELDLPAKDIADPQVSPSGQLLSVTVNQPDGKSDIWVYDLATKTFDRRTYDGNARNGIWSDDGEHIIFAIEGDSSIWQITARGIIQADMLFKNQNTAGLTQAPESLAPNGAGLSFTQGALGAGNIYSLNFIDGRWNAQPNLDTPANTWASTISYDGKWVAYTDSDDGNIFISPYPNSTEGKLRVSFEGGREPHWAADELKLYYLNYVDQQLMSVDFTTTANGDLRVEPPVELFRGNHISTFDPPSFDLSPDGDKFLMMRSEEENAADDTGAPATLNIVDNWFTELSRLAPPNPDFVSD